MEIDERGVSPVVGTILLIAITVILAGTIGFFAMQQGTPEAAPTVSLSLEGGPGNYTLYHNGGDSLDSANLEIRGQNPIGWGNNITGSGTFDAGDSTWVNFDSGGSFSLVHTPTDSVLLRTDVESN